MPYCTNFLVWCVLTSIVAVLWHCHSSVVSRWCTATAPRFTVAGHTNTHCILQNFWAPSLLLALLVRRPLRGQSGYFLWPAGFVPSFCEEFPEWSLVWVVMQANEKRNLPDEQSPCSERLNRVDKKCFQQGLTKRSITSRQHWWMVHSAKDVLLDEIQPRCDCGNYAIPVAHNNMHTLPFS